MAARSSKAGGDGTRERKMSVPSPPRLPTDGDALDSINVSVPSRLPHDSFSRRGSAQSGSSPSVLSRASSHRPSPLILPPAPLGDFESHESREEDGHPRSNRGSPPDKASRLVRKRSAPFDSRRTGSSEQDEEDENHQHGQFGVIALRTPSSAEIPQRDSICFCARAPKVPRPRNAFILYRQHHQSQVVTDNPGLANPDISKIIGQMWKDQTEEVKNAWKQLAEEEKLRHRIQYPDYRYQPRRAGKGESAGGGRPGSAAGEAGYDGTDNGDGDPNRCEKCGGRYLAPLSTSRSIASSARASIPPPSPFGMIRTNTLSSLSGSEVDTDRQRGPFTSPRPQKHVQSSADSYQREAGRRPLPHHGRPGSLSMGSRSGHQEGEEHGEDFDMPISADQKRRRYDAATPFSARFPPTGMDSGSSHGQHSYRIPHRSHHDGSPPPPQVPSSAPLPQFPSSGPAPSPSSPWMGPPPPPPLRQPVRGYGSLPPSHGRAYPEYHHNRASAGSQEARSRTGELVAEGLERAAGGGESYGGMPARLPPLQGGPYGYCQVPGSGGGSAMATPSTAMAGLSIRPTATPVPAMPPISARPLAGGAGHRGGSQQQQHHQRHTPGFVDESLKLPPLMTAVPTTHAQRPPPDSGIGNSRPGSDHAGVSRTLPPSAKNNGGLVSSNRFGAGIGTRVQDMHMFAVSPMPMTEGDADKDSQASGIRAMVMSVPYLSKLEVLRRISPPRPTIPKRGPIIAIEGHNTALIEAVGRIVEQALIQSGECAVGVWSTAAKDHFAGNSGPVTPAAAAGKVWRVEMEEKSDGNINSRADMDEPGGGGASSGAGNVYAKKNSTDSGMGSSIDDMSIDGMALSPASGDDGGCSSAATHGQSRNPLLAYHQFIMSWHAKSRDILRHITTPGAGAAGAKSKVVTPTAPASLAAPPSPAKSPMHSPTPLSPAAAGTADSSASTSPRHSPYLPSIARAASSSSMAASEPLLPIALITGGYSLAISDQYAMTVPIDDAFPPIGHWEWMATLWRGIAGPDLVVYADVKPPVGREDPNVNTRAQEGVIVVHVNPKQNEGDKASTGNDEGWESSALDKKTERRLAFEVMEWVRSGNFGGF